MAGVSDSADGTATARARLSGRLRSGDKAAREVVNKERVSRVFMAGGKVKVGIVDWLASVRVKKERTGDTCAYEKREED